MDELETQNFIKKFNNLMNDGSLNISEIENYMKLVDLPFECQINKINKEETFSNLYCWFKVKNNNHLINKLPEPYFSIYIEDLVKEYCN